mgnify:CR=1 FL=1
MFNIRLHLIIPFIVLPILFTLAACGGDDDQNTGPLQLPRYEHTATLLQDGNVLLAGGLDINGVGIGNGELYNPSTDSWSLTGMMSAARGNYDTTLLPDGRVLAVAGKSSELGNIGSTEAYNPATNQWNWLAADGLTRNAHQVTLLPNGLVMISGGLLIHKRGTFSAYKTIATDKIETTSVQHFDMVTGKTTEATPLTHARKEHRSLLLADGRVLIIGGLVNETVDGPNIDSLNSTEIYDHASDSWSLGAVMTQGRGLHTATTLPDGKILVTGGLNTARQPLNSAELYDQTTDSWAPVGSMSQARDGHTATLLSDARVLVVGGNGTSAGLSLTSAEIYDPSSNSWSSARNMLDGRSHHTTVQLNDGRVLVAGGLLGTDNPLSTVDFYSTATNSWSSAIQPSN